MWRLNEDAPIKNVALLDCLEHLEQFSRMTRKIKTLNEGVAIVNNTENFKTINFCNLNN